MQIIDCFIKKFNEEEDVGNNPGNRVEHIGRHEGLRLLDAIKFGGGRALG